MYAQVTSSTMKSLAHCGRGREKSGKIERQKISLNVASFFYAFDGETKQHMCGDGGKMGDVSIRSKFEV